MTPKVDIIVPVYNARKYLAKCIRSIQKQTFTDWHLILVDDGSTDGSAEICDRFCAPGGDKRISVVHQKNSGSLRARLTGIARASSEFIAFVDADDLVESEMLQRLLDAQKEFSADIVSCGFKRLSHNGWIKRSYCRNSGVVILTSGKEEAVHIAATTGTISMSGKIYRREIFTVSQNEFEALPDVFHGEDIMINTVIFSKAERVVLLSDELYVYRIGGRSTYCSEKSLQDLAEAYRWRKDYLTSVDADIKYHKTNLDMVLHTVVYYAHCSKTIMSREKICTELAPVIADIAHISPNYKHRNAYDLSFPMTDQEFRNIYRDSLLVIIKAFILRIL